jgi:hypothetical protein
MNSSYTSLNFDLGETNDLLRPQINQFAAAEIAPLAQATDLNNEFPSPLWKKWASWVCWVLPVMNSMGVRVWAIYPIVSQWKKLAALQHRLV